ncbi:unnamed protein product [Rotaria socialis]|uniref:Cytochrome c oxidase assembly protein COX16 homolog, mitochondrial n=1 Tax=Rotaria socialis TaxID=392032 RepID=A0A820NQ29_9BILA|nr:unnamed protein product [Rotaria socialis]CAF3272907.1 unnamed protein product [Rotaria socialis]CAF3415989.1 unnamed protein product [Rotaria socialis]CAF4365330.1 unnamed protein product [Rotaria socialis]CAF4366308.1 unnamed protein product [Rotaria socialis]
MGVIYVTIRSASWVRYDRRRQQVKTYSRDEIKAKGLDYGEPTTLEEEYEQMVNHQNLDAWEQTRIQRPWHEEPDKP